MVSLFLAIALSFGVTSKTDPIVITVDKIELNHYCPNGVRAFSQIVFWKEHPFGLNQSRFHSYGFVIFKDDDMIGGMPEQKENGLFEFNCLVGRHRFTVQSRLYIETWTATDPEAIDRRKFWNGNSPNLFRVPSETTGQPTPVENYEVLLPPPM